jgi:hypothetical protein
MIHRPLSNANRAPDEVRIFIILEMNKNSFLGFLTMGGRGILFCALARTQH